MTIYHLSHTDLDGYGCQFVSNFYLKNVKFYNSNYGIEIDEKFEQILDDIGEKEAVILITDLNLTPTQCETYQSEIRGKKIKLFLLDHHQTGQICADKFDWYYLDNSRCATKITYDFFSGIFGENAELSELVDVVNAVDIWLKDEKYFELGKVCMGAISGAREVSRVMFGARHSDYIFYLIENFKNYIAQNDAHIALDNDLHKIKKGFFLLERDDTLSNLVSDYLVKILSDEKERFTVFYDGFKGLLTHNIGSVSVIGNDFLVANPEFDFFLDITSKKSMSFRANNKCDVSQMAADLVGGGGHKNASGGLFKGFKDSSNYEIIKTQIVDLLNKEKR